MPAMWIGASVECRGGLSRFFAPSPREDERTILRVMPLLMKLLRVVSICLLFQVTISEFQSTGHHMGVHFFSVFSL